MKYGAIAAQTASRTPLRSTGAGRGLEKATELGLKSPLIVAANERTKAS